MDTSSQNVVRAFRVLASVVGQMRSFGYELYLETQAHSWTQPHCILMSDQGFQIIEHERIRRFDGALAVSSTIQCDVKATRSIAFSLLLAWDTDIWLAQSTVEMHDYREDDPTTEVWSSPEFHETTLDGVIRSVQEATHLLIGSVNVDSVANALAIVERRTL